MESLLLFRRALPSPTMCRFIPALSVPERSPVPSSPLTSGVCLSRIASRPELIDLEVGNSDRWPFCVGPEFPENGNPGNLPLPTVRVGNSVPY
jgi:hypothetical protein